MTHPTPCAAYHRRHIDLRLTSSALCLRMRLPAHPQTTH